MHERKVVGSSHDPEILGRALWRSRAVDFLWLAACVAVAASWWLRDWESEVKLFCKIAKDLDDPAFSASNAALRIRGAAEATVMLLYSVGALLMEYVRRRKKKDMV
jgi:hypothetical protein